jgi:hypothetical protein
MTALPSGSQWPMWVPLFGHPGGRNLANAETPRSWPARTTARNLPGLA